MNMLEKAVKILESPVCDHCLGRQYGQLLSGMSNQERGKLIRLAAAMSIDNEKAKTDMDMSNFTGINFHNLEAEEAKPKECSICGGIFQKLGKYAEKIRRAGSRFEYSTFVVGTKLSYDLLAREESLWEKAGIDYVEPLKAEINREIGKHVEKITGRKFMQKEPDAVFLIDMSTGTVTADIKPLFIYGEYQKLRRGIPQTRWPSGKYKTSVEQIIAKPFMKACGGRSHKFHGMGREDIDARCLGWRPFVLEIEKPLKRSIDIAKAGKKISSAVRARNLRMSDVAEIRRIKEARPWKTYVAKVSCTQGFAKTDIAKIRLLKTQILQQTPLRVLHRRADIRRKRIVREIKAKIQGKNLILTITGDAGLYIKELVSGDSGRTKPSLAEILEKDCICKELDVVKIHII